MNSRHARTLRAVFSEPVPASIEWQAIEALLIAAGGRPVEGAGSRVRFERNGVVASFHRPHPAEEARRYQVRDARVPDENRRRARSIAMNVMTYEGFHARVDFDAEDGLFIGHIAGINDVVGFHGETTSELVAAFHEAVDDYVATCRAIGKEPEKAYSGKLMLRIAPEVHASAALAAQLAGTSLNQWAEDVLRRAGSTAAASVPADA